MMLAVGMSATASAAFGIRLLIILVCVFLHAGVLKQSGFVVQDAIFVVVEPHGIGIAAHDADFSAVGRAVRVPQQLHDDHTILAARQARDGFVGDGGNFGLALVVGDGHSGVTFDTREALLGLVQDVPCRFDWHIE